MDGGANEIVTHEWTWMKWMGYSGIALCACLGFVLENIRYQAFGKPAEAKIVNIRQEAKPARRGGNPRIEQIIEYEFTDEDGNLRKDEAAVNSKDPPDVALGTLPIEYMRHVSRQRGKDSPGLYIVLALSLFAFLLFLGLYIRDMRRGG